MSLADAHTEVMTALQAGSLSVVSELDRAAPVVGRQLRVRVPVATGQVVGGVCQAWTYEVVVEVIPDTDDLDQLVDDTDTAMGLLADANINAISAAPANRVTSQYEQVPMYEITCTLD